MSALEGKADVPVLQRARKKALRVKNPETGTYPGCSAYSCRSLQPQISRKVRKFIRHFKGHFSIGNVQVRILPGQPGILADGPDHLAVRKGPQQRTFHIGLLSPWSHFAFRVGQTAKSLQPTSQLFPFCGDGAWRLWFDRHCGQAS
jgi:hypothetical protein